MDTLEKMTEELTAKVGVFLTRIAEEAIVSADEPDLLDESEISSFVERTLHGLSIDRRVGLHAAAWVNDVEEYAKKLTCLAINEKLKKAAKTALTTPEGGAGREF